MKNTTKYIAHGASIIIFFFIVGLSLNACMKRENNDLLSSTNEYYAKDLSFSDEDIQEIARLHNVYLADMLNAGISNIDDLADYVINNYDDYKSLSHDTVVYLINYYTQVTQSDLIGVINKHIDKFDNPKLLINYLNQAYSYLDNFDDNLLQNLENQAQINLSEKEWRVFYLYISLMRASKQFWVDQGHYNQVINNLTTNGYGAKKDIKEVISEDVVGVALTVLVGTVVGIINPALAIGILSVSGLATSAAASSLRAVID